MELREGIAHLAGRPILSWPVFAWKDWRRCGPAAGSLVTHLCMGVGLIVLMGAAQEPRRIGLEYGSPLEVELFAEAMPAEGLEATPPEARLAPPSRVEPGVEVLFKARRQPERDARIDPRQTASFEPESPGGADPEEEGGVYRGDATYARSGVALGLRSLLETDPCNPDDGAARGDCSRDWAALMEQGDVSVSPSYQRLAELYPGYRAPGRRGLYPGVDPAGGRP
jgi:hypothetical protein